VNPRKNMTILDFILSYRYSLRNFSKIDFLIGYKNTYKNSLNILYRSLIKQKFPINATLKNGKKIQLKNARESYLLTAKSFWKYSEIQDDHIIIHPKHMDSIKFFDWLERGDLIAIFLSEEYKFLPVKGQIVIDIGGNAGDSAIYFALKGAKKVIALEPSVLNYNTAQKNLKINNQLDKVEFLLAACSDKNGTIKIDPNMAGNQAKISLSDNGTSIPTFSLKHILENYDIDSAVLKIDCEGCEYDSILGTSKENLRKFSHIQIEYHYGYRNLQSKLEECGFDVESSKPIRFKKGEYVGFINATRNNDQ
jgi:FkbM family methyltransferase